MTRIEAPEAHVTREQEIGLRLPNGTAIFPPATWHDHSLETAAQREVIVGLIKAAALNLGYDTDHFLPHYAWTTREKISAVVYEQGDELPLVATGQATFVNGNGGATGIWDGEELVPEQTLPNGALVD